MICEERLWQYHSADYPIDPIDNLASESDPLMHHGFDIGPDLVSLRPELHPGLDLATDTLINNSVGLVHPCECLLKVTLIAQLLTLIEHTLHLLRPLCSLFLIVGGLNLYYRLPPLELCI